MNKILIVDDEKEIREIFKVYFKNFGFREIHTAGDGLEAFALCTQHKFDLITLDHNMPFMNGASFLSAIRSKEGQNKCTPIMMISAFIPDIEESAKAFEETYFFDKPVNFESLGRTAKIILYKKDE